MHPLTRRCCSHFGSGSLPIFRALTRHRVSRGSLNNLLYAPLPSWFARRNHDAPSESQHADAVVIGAGPAGIAVVGNLLESAPRAKVVWIDRSFEGGSIGQYYREIPSYSPAGDFLAYARALRTFRDICDAAPKPNAITALQGFDPELTCPLTHAADMLKLVSDGLAQHGRVNTVLGIVTQVVRSSKTKQWKVTLLPPSIGHTQPPQTYTTPMVVYCTGTRPHTNKLPSPGIPRLSLDTGLAPSRLAKLLPADGKKRTVAVIGDGHSAVLALRNLVRLAAAAAGSHPPLLRIRWFTRRRALRYVEDGREWGQLVNEYDGLTGEAARFARSQLEGEKLGPPHLPPPLREGEGNGEEGKGKKRSDAARYITRFVLPEVDVGRLKGAAAERVREAAEREAMKGDLEGVDFVLQAVGFVRARLPETRPGLTASDGPIGKPKRLVFNGLMGSFFPDSTSMDRVMGLFGAGSAFPEQVLTSEGWRAPAVGVWRFMQFAQRIVPRWVEGTRTGGFKRRVDRDRRVEERKKYHQWF
ncbi:pyridine nucleotide-disulfide oxidoreductase-domain-containing protein [Chaetomidium leptoderma]|uniref:Pyridine nucleotide-disulfide oxidoreductase-domain-containing protein n=1 Tax=Chaetomidium leptoderma TaxID=669021 RepID=A0AAN6VC51_9PEZI|nr:pyridine nucleotide-disulfide oxidoreductase-domain-containing protein [Chaetomidium leptoderma]